ncbi:Uncharacterised protein [Chromobacterium violaceum]|uniref:Uncharacterized protein n=1 Tax=Chromobacterium violaceum TaxID=536 RepID=A0AAX2M7X7_CHRVL|nr:Uncharacterised protein [Chromobacterium violaceum]
MIHASLVGWNGRGTLSKKQLTVNIESVVFRPNPMPESATRHAEDMH